MSRTTTTRETGAATRRLPIPTPSYRVSDCGRFCWGFYRKRDGSIGEDAKLDHDSLAIWTAHKWREDSKGYLVANVWDGSKPKGLQSTQIQFHRSVVRVPGSLLVDHRYGNKKDNRRAMLRLATHQQNSWNRRKDRRSRSSRFLGVTLHRQLGKYQVQSKTGGKNTYLGVFDNEVEAAEAYNRHVRATRGRFAVANRITPKMRAEARRKTQARLLRNAKAPASLSGDKAAA